jgi:hypothetical protein
MSKENETTAPTPGYMLHFTADLGNGRQVQIAGNLPIGATREAFDSELDKLCGAVQRKQDQATIPALENGIAQAEAQLEAQRKDRERIEASYADKNQPVQKQRDLQVADNAIDALTNKVARDRELLVKLKASVGE